MRAETIASIPKEPGSYVVWLNLPVEQTIQIGRLGEFAFSAGDYIYFGSARGPGGLRARLGRHLRRDRKIHWHVDYLRAVSQVKGFGYLLANEAAHPLAMECQWSQALVKLIGCSVPVPGFGASDCSAGCQAHLIWMEYGEPNFLPWLATNSHINLVIFP